MVHNGQIDPLFDPTLLGRERRHNAMKDNGEQSKGQQGMKSTQNNPAENVPCIWMTAGVISYKLCNFGYECETCPFDQAMRKRTQNGD